MQIKNINCLTQINRYSSIWTPQIKNTQENVSVPDNRGQSQLSNVFYYPVNFEGSKRTFSTSKRKLAEKSGDFYVARFNNLPCPACGKKMINLSMFGQIASELAQLKPEEYLDCLGKYTDYMRPVEESVYNELTELSKIQGNSKDIRTLLVQLRNQKLPTLQKVQMKTVNKMRRLARTLPDDEQAVLENKIKSLVGLIRKTNSEAPFRRKIVLDRISKIKIRNPYKYDKLQRIAKTFPTSSDMNSAWIVKYSGKNKFNQDWDSYSIALRFLSSSIANTDHIIAYDIDNNHDDISNYMAMHSACNSQKGNKSFLQWLNEDKTNRIKYMKEYFDDVYDLVTSKKITKKKYKHYVAHATQTVFEASKGQIKIDTDDELPLSHRKK